MDGPAPSHLKLPTVRRDALQQCRVSRGASLADCALLLPAGTGTQSLRDLLSAALGKAADPRLVHHSHHVRIGSYPSPPPRCYVVSLRDPAARLSSGLALAWLNTSPFRPTRPSASGTVSLGLAFGPGVSRRQRVRQELRSLVGFVAAFRNASHPDHHTARQLYRSSVSWPKQVEPLAWDAVSGGYNFLVSQLDYLRGWDGLARRCAAGRAELHLLCTETLERDARALLRRFNVSPGAPPVHANRRAIAASADAQEEARAAEFVRRKLFPWDTALHRHVCGR